mmetsp:Transcript_42510/g.70144  ORF Transcript_42510/g.70144 Transcript_42510/m.70144 type:complete len:272 (+) Transcript_42510:208-1023(+)
MSTANIHKTGDIAIATSTPGVSRRCYILRRKNHRRASYPVRRDCAQTTCIRNADHVAIVKIVRDAFTGANRRHQSRRHLSVVDGIDSQVIQVAIGINTQQCLVTVRHNARDRSDSVRNTRLGFCLQFTLLSGRRIIDTLDINRQNELIDTGSHGRGQQVRVIASASLDAHRSDDISTAWVGAQEVASILTINLGNISIKSGVAEHHAELGETSGDHDVSTTHHLQRGRRGKHQRQKRFNQVQHDEADTAVIAVIAAVTPVTVTAVTQHVLK